MKKPCPCSLTRPRISRTPDLRAAGPACPPETSLDRRARSWNTITIYTCVFKRSGGNGQHRVGYGTGSLTREALRTRKAERVMPRPMRKRRGVSPVRRRAMRCYPRYSVWLFQRPPPLSSPILAFAVRCCARRRCSPQTR